MAHSALADQGATATDGATRGCTSPPLPWPGVPGTIFFLVSKSGVHPGQGPNRTAIFHRATLSFPQPVNLFR